MKSPLLERKDEEFDIIAWIDFLAERYGWTVPEIMELPIPTFFALQEAINKRSEKEKKELNKGRK